MVVAFLAFALQCGHGGEAVDTGEKAKIQPTPLVGAIGYNLRCVWIWQKPATHAGETGMDSTIISVYTSLVRAHSCSVDRILENPDLRTKYLAQVRQTLGDLPEEQ